MTCRFYRFPVVTLLRRCSTLEVLQVRPELFTGSAPHTSLISLNLFQLIEPRRDGQQHSLTTICSCVRRCHGQKRPPDGGWRAGGRYTKGRLFILLTLCRRSRFPLITPRKLFGRMLHMTELITRVSPRGGISYHFPCSFRCVMGV